MITCAFHAEEPEKDGCFNINVWFTGLEIGIETVVVCNTIETGNLCT